MHQVVPTRDMSLQALLRVGLLITTILDVSVGLLVVSHTTFGLALQDLTG